MTDDELRKVLGQTPPPLDAGHRARLEGELLAAYDRRMGVPRVSRSPWLRYAPAAVILLCLVTATQVPAGYKVEVGRRISLVFAPGTVVPRELGEQVAETLRTQGSRVVDVSVRRKSSAGGGERVQVDVFGDALAVDAEALARLRTLPLVAGARQVRVEQLEGRVHATLLGAMGHRLFLSATSPEAREAARQRLIEEVRRVEGPGASVDVEVEEGGTGKRRVRVKVQKPAHE
jgi:hypothetical protein